MRAGTACRSNRTRTAASAIFIWRPGAGQQTVDFQNSRDHGGELVTIENPIFKTAYVGPALTLVSINGHHSAYLQNCVGYGIGQEALITFYMSEDAFARQDLVLFYTPSLAPSDMTGFSDDGGGYYYYTPANRDCRR